MQGSAPAPQAAAFFLNFRAHGAQRIQMQVDRPGSQVAAAGLRAHRLPAAAQNRPQKHHRRAHAAHQLLRNLAAGNLAGIHHQIRSLPVNGAAQMPDDLHGRIHIAEGGTPPQAADAGAEYRGRQHGQHTVFGSLHRHRTGELPAALHQNDAHIPPPFFIECTPSYAGGSL